MAFDSNPFESNPFEANVPANAPNQSPPELLPAPGFITPDQCTVDDGCEDTFLTVELANSQIRPAVKSLVELDFFRFFKLQLYKECPFWPENSMCFNPSCAVEINEDAPYDVLISNSSLECDYCNTSEELQADAVYVDLTLNPERFSGYGGQEAGRIWQAIYQENCFNKPKLEELPKDMSPALRFNNKYLNLLASWLNRLQKNRADNYEKLAMLMNQADDQCIEKRVFYRLVSGMHASIATHLSFEWLDTTKKNAKFEPNLGLWMSRVGYYPERLANIYFNYLLVLKAILKLAEHLKQIQFSPTNVEREYISEIISLVAPYERSVFNESLLFNYEDDLLNQLLKNEFRANFKNVSALMDCVGCERCRLWGKVQTLGYGTALKVLFELNGENPEFDVTSLKRLEIVALVNTFDRLSKSLEIIRYFREEYEKQNGVGEIGGQGEAYDFNTKKVEYQQKIFTKGKGKDIKSDANAVKKLENDKPVTESKPTGEEGLIKPKQKEEVKMPPVFKSKHPDQSPGTKGRARWESDLIRFDGEDEDDLENLTPEEVKYREIFHNSLKLKASTPRSQKTLRHYFVETIEEFRDAFRFVANSYLSFPMNLYKMALVYMEGYWNWFIGNEDYFRRKEKELSRLY